MKYEIDEGSLTVPDGLVDRSVNMLMSPDGRNLSVVVTRDHLQSGETVDGFIKRQLADLSRRVNKFEEIGRAPAILGADPSTQIKGVQISTRFKQSGQLTHQLQAVFELVNRNHLLIFTCSSLAPHNDAEKSVWQQLLTSFARRA
jgi:hypothetical protein